MDEFDRFKMAWMPVSHMSRKILRRGLIFFLLLGCKHGVNKLSDVQVAQAALSDDPRYDGVVNISYRLGGSTNACTASIIGKNATRFLLLTAKHCVVGSETRERSAFRLAAGMDIFVEFGPGGVPDLSGSAKVISAQFLGEEPAPGDEIDFDEDVAALVVQISSDLALRERILRARPLGIAPRSVAEGDAVILIGFGRQECSNAGNTGEYGFKSVGNHNVSEVGWNGRISLETPPGSTRPYVCTGDSGGPLLRLTTDQAHSLVIVGVAGSRSISGDGHDSYYLDTADGDVADFIRRELAQFQNRFRQP